MEERIVQSEYGGLVLGADGAFGIFGVQDPGGAALSVSVHIHRFHLKSNTHLVFKNGNGNCVNHYSLSNVYELHVLNFKYDFYR